MDNPIEIMEEIKTTGMVCATVTPMFCMVFSYICIAVCFGVLLATVQTVAESEKQRLYETYATEEIEKAFRTIPNVGQSPYGREAVILAFRDSKFLGLLKTLNIDATE